MSERCIVLLAGEGPSTRMVYHALREALPKDVRLEVILEKPVSRKTFLKRRVKRLGLATVIGQVLFVGLIVPLLTMTARRRIEEIKREHRLNDAPLPRTVHRVASANSDEARLLLSGLDPVVVVVNGTRILSRETLGSMDAPFINMHAGITPRYRGVHGAYWALAEGKPELVGTTIHRVDEGIDTGEIIDQVFFSVSKADSFATYPYLHTAAGLAALVRSVNAFLDGNVSKRRMNGEMSSVLRYHPTAWQYLKSRASAGVR